MKSKFLQLKDLDARSVVEDGCNEGLPSAYRNARNGLFLVKGFEAEQLTYGPIVPLRRGVGCDKKSFPQLELMALNSFDECANVILDMSNLDQGRAVRALAEVGVNVCAGQGKKFETFLMHCMNLRIPLSLVATGSCHIDGQYAFVHGHNSYYNALTGGFNDIQLQNADLLPSSIRSSGTFKNWYEGIEKYACGSAQVFVLASSIASYFLPLMNEDNAIFHFYGKSTTGKTLLLQLSASVHGCGGEPGDVGGSMLGRWYATGNGVEGYLAQYSGFSQSLDELSALTGRDFGALLYNIVSGASKGRMTRQLNAQKTRKWSGYIHSSGEISIAEKLAEANKMLTEGQQHRAMSIEIKPEDAGKEGETVAEIRARADALKKLVVTDYGVAIIELLGRLVSIPADDGTEVTYAVLLQEIHELVVEVKAQLVGDLTGKGFNLTSVQHRALHRFAVVGAWGRFVAVGTDFTILPFTEEQVYSSVLDMAVRWLADAENQYSPERQAMVKIHQNLQQKRHVHLVSENVSNRDMPSLLWGYTRGADFLILNSVFDKWCESCGIAPHRVAKKLVDAGLLKPECASHYKKRLIIRGSNEHVYQISQRLVELDPMRDFKAELDDSVAVESFEDTFDEEVEVVKQPVTRKTLPFPDEMDED